MTTLNEAQIADLALSAHPMATLVVDLDGAVLYSNAAARNAFGLTQDGAGAAGSIEGWGLRRMPLPELLRAAAISSNWIPAIFYRGDEAVHARARGMRAKGGGAPLVLITSVADATTQFQLHAKQIRELNMQVALYQKKSMELEESVAVSKVLERELVHRVKNNLAVVSALLNQQARSSGDEIVTDALKSAASRIKSIAVVHDVLDRNQQTEVVNVADLVVQLAAGIRTTLCPPRIALVTETQMAVVHVDVALPLALLVNELVTSAITHAFVGRPRGRILVTSAVEGTEVEIRVADDGVGHPSGAKGAPREPRLVAALVDQIGGSIDRVTGDGTEWVLRFPSDPQRAYSSPM
ncbi:sensor histidine kinase [Flavimaricola marinus]|uniref:histidine kinase n=1 Tax=Flavimaricola marinus TaxID=1819565 RepID=A0A238LFS3_9RHOB|nr:histidine kinase dimerization/phosphoacceptor domain -containing protein [Flavimaricola marinus]SMY08481.1 putative sensor histidine kinase pdtaS [Flavimaricola marinus]